MCAHVTNWNRSTSIKFRTDVAMMCKLGFDIIVKDLPDDELQFCRQALRNYNRLKHTILDGDFYRLVFAYDLNPRYGEQLPSVRLTGLAPICATASAK